MQGYKYPIGTKFYQWKYLSWDNKESETEGNYKVNGITTGHIWISPELGGIYSAKVEEECEQGDANWGKSMSKNTAISDKTLDKQHGRI